MKRAGLVVAAGLVTLVLQGALATLLPRTLCPDLGLLFVVALGLAWERATTGLVLSAGLGFAADLLSGSLVGQHALLRLFVFAAARLASRQLNLRGALPLTVFAGATSLAYALAVWLLTGFFVGSGAPGLELLGGALLHAVVNALAAPLVVTGLERTLALAAVEEAGRRPLRLEPRRSGT